MSSVASVDEMVKQLRKQAQIKAGWAIAIGVRFATALFVAGGVVAVIVFTLSGTRWQLLRKPHLSPPSTRVNSRQHTKVVSLALQEVGTKFEPDLSDQAAAWVRHIFKQAGLQLKVSQQPLDNRLPTNPESANSLIGPDIGEIILNPAELKPGDIVSFSWSYDPDTIVHVGIYAGNGQMVDRQSEDGLVVEHSLNSLHWTRFFAGVRLQSSSSISSPVRSLNQCVLCYL